MKTACNLLQEIIDKMCLNYCKYGEKIDSAGDDDAAVEKITEKHCENCPLNKII